MIKNSGITMHSIQLRNTNNLSFQSKLYSRAVKIVHPAENDLEPFHSPLHPPAQHLLLGQTPSVNTHTHT